MSDDKVPGGLFDRRITLGNVLTILGGCGFAIGLFFRLGGLQAHMEEGTSRVEMLVNTETAVRQEQVKGIEKQFGAMADDVHEIRDILFKQTQQRR